MKTFLGLPIYKTGVSFLSSLRHIMSIILFTGFGYFLSAIAVGGISGDVWMFVQSPEKHYLVQLLLLVLGVFLGVVMKGQLNKFDNGEIKFFFHYPKLDKYLYPIGFILAYLIINEIFGL